MFKKTFFILLLFVTDQLVAQVSGARIIHIKSAHTAFPDTGRTRGHLYNNKLYTTEAHYRDSTVLIIAPEKLDAGKKVDFVFWFHGWMNSVDSAAKHYNLIKQFIASNRNAVLVLAETAKDAPDSYEGKLQNSGMFRLLVNDVLAALKSNRTVKENAIAGSITLAGHSGAYKAMAFIVQNGGMPISEVVLFDALYAETDKYMAWIKADDNHRFYDLYTDHGGTDGESLKMVKRLTDEQISVTLTEEKDINPEKLKANRILFIHSLREHDFIINNPDNFELILETDPFLKSVKR